MLARLKRYVGSGPECRFAAGQDVLERHDLSMVSARPLREPLTNDVPAGVRDNASNSWIWWRSVTVLYGKEEGFFNHRRVVSAFSYWLASYRLDPQNYRSSGRCGRIIRGELCSIP